MLSLALLGVGMVIVVATIVFGRWHPFIALTAAGLTVAVLTPQEAIYRSKLDASQRKRLSGVDGSPGQEMPPELAPAHARAKAYAEKWFVGRFTEAFGKGCGEITLVIAMATIIGQCLLDSGGAKRIVDSLMRVMGARGAPFAFAGSAFTLGIPVFFDTVFYLLLPLGKALRRETGKDYLLFILTIVAGATMAHSLVPPTPGPLSVAASFGEQVSIGSMMLGGIVVGFFTAAVGVAYAYWANRRWDLPLREEGWSAAEAPASPQGPLPPLSFALLPILLPVLLIGGEAVLSARKLEVSWMQLLGDKNIALILSAGVALWLLAWAKSKGAGASPKEAIQSALASGGVIILITAAGGAFGAMLRDTNIAELISGSIEGRASLMLILVAYLVTALIRTAQGSATVAMITAGGIVAPVALEADLSYSALYLALAIGCGSKPISWANDSGFWLIGRMTGMSPLETFKSVSVMMFLMSLAGLGLIYLGAIFLPLR